MNYKKRFIKLLLLSVILYVVVYRIITLCRNFKSSVDIKYNENYEWTLNNNVIQYSSYIIVDSTNNGTFRVEGYLHPNFRNLQKKIRQEIFICLLKNTLTNEILSLEVAENPHYANDRNRKFIFYFKMDDFKSLNSSINKIVVAIIRKEDYNSSLDDSVITEILINDSKPVVLPYSMLNFQKPTVIYTNEPRLPGVGLCLQHTFQLQNYTVAWVKSQFELGISEIAMYDATDNYTLTKLLRENIPSDYKLVILPYDISLTAMCNENLLLQQHFGKKNFFQIEIFMKKTCRTFFQNEFVIDIKTDWRGKHAYMTQNDGFSQLGQKYEYYALYDLDEFIFPHSPNHQHDQLLKQDITCDNICKTELFNDYKNNFYKSMNIYNYVKTLINDYTGRLNKKRISSIFFDQALYITSNEVLSKLMSDIDKILAGDLAGDETVEIKLYDERDSNTIFRVNKYDFDHMRHLSKTYSNLLKCNSKRNFNVYDDKSTHEQFQNYFYLTADLFDHWGKTIHYSKLTKTIYTHLPSETERNTWILKPNATYGHLLSHFRFNLNQYLFHNMHVKFRIMNITNLNVNIEYIFYMANRFNFC